MSVIARYTVAGSTTSSGVLDSQRKAYARVVAVSAKHEDAEMIAAALNNFEGAVEALETIRDWPMPDGNASCASALERVKLLARQTLGRGQ